MDAACHLASPQNRLRDAGETSQLGWADRVGLKRTRGQPGDLGLKPDAAAVPKSRESKGAFPTVDSFRLCADNLVKQKHGRVPTPVLCSARALCPQEGRACSPASPFCVFEKPSSFFLFDENAL